MKWIFACRGKANDQVARKRAEEGDGGGGCIEMESTTR